MNTPRSFVLVTVSVMIAVAVLLSAAVDPASAKQVNLRLGHSEAVANIRHDVTLFFAKRVDEISKGEVKIEIFPAGVLGTHQGCQEQVAMGTLDFYITTAGLVSVFDPNRTQELLELPYLFDNYSQAYAFMDQPFVAKYYEPLIAKGIRYLATWDNGFRQMTNNTRPINTPADMKGLKIRVVQSEMSINIINALGGSAVPMSYSELYTALSQGVVDGQENPFMNIYASKFYEVQKFLSVTRHQYSTLPLIISEKTLEETRRQSAPGHSESLAGGGRLLPQEGRRQRGRPAQGHGGGRNENQQRVRPDASPEGGRAGLRLGQGEMGGRQGRRGPGGG